MRFFEHRKQQPFFLGFTDIFQKAVRTACFQAFEVRTELVPDFFVDAGIDYYFRRFFGRYFHLHAKKRRVDGAYEAFRRNRKTSFGGLINRCAEMHRFVKNYPLGMA